MTLAISIDSILATVFAYSAIRKTTEQTPAILGKRENPTLRQLVYFNACRLNTELIGIAQLDRSEPFTLEVEILTLETDVNPAEPLGTTLRSIIETTLTAMVLASVWKDYSELEKMYLDLAAQNIKNIKAHYSRASYRIKPG